MTIVITFSKRINKRFNELPPSPLYSLQPMWLWAFVLSAQKCTAHNKHTKISYEEIYDDRFFIAIYSYREE